MLTDGLQETQKSILKHNTARTQLAEYRWICTQDIVRLVATRLSSEGLTMGINWNLATTTIVRAISYFLTSFPFLFSLVGALHWSLSNLLGGNGDNGHQILYRLSLLVNAVIATVHTAVGTAVGTALCLTTGIVRAMPRVSSNPHGRSRRCSWGCNRRRLLLMGRHTKYLFLRLSFFL